MLWWHFAVILQLLIHLCIKILQLFQYIYCMHNLSFTKVGTHHTYYLLDLYINWEQIFIRLYYIAQFRPNDGFSMNRWTVCLDQTPLDAKYCDLLSRGAAEGQHTQAMACILPFSNSFITWMCSIIRYEMNNFHFPLTKSLIIYESNTKWNFKKQ